MCEIFLMKKFRKIPVRAWIIAMIFMTAFMNNALASNISFLIRYMVKLPKEKPVAYCNKQIGGPAWVPNEEPNYGPRYDWSSTAQRHIQMAYFYGIAIASPASGFLAEWLGPKNTIFFPLLFAGLVNILGAFGAKWGWGIPLVCRFVVGLTSGTVFPALQCLVGRWAPPNEKGKFVNAFMGSSIGTSVVWVMIRYSAPILGWTWSFYILSIFIGIYCIVFWIATASYPEEHKYISEEEIDYIRECQGGTVSLYKNCPPFRQIITSSPCWALTILNFGSWWGAQIQLQVVPKFIESYMGITTNESVFLAILPHIARFGSGIIFGNMADLIRRKNLMSSTRMSKAYVFFSHLIPGFIMMSLGTVKCDVAAACSLLILSNFLTGAAVGTDLRNPTDLSPNFAGTIYGINLCLAQTTGFIVPYSSEWIIGSHGGILQWTFVFLIGGGVYFGTGMYYLWFGSAEVQSWNTKWDKGRSSLILT